MGTRRGPLRSVRVVDFTENMAGPFGTMILADQGADVIKVESPKGDIIRHTGSGSKEMAGYFANLNRSKRALAIDLHRPEARQVIEALMDSADVVAHSFRPEAARRLGLDADTVTARRPSLVYAAIVGFGSEGPLAGRPVYDHVIQAVSGMASLQRESEDDVPHLVRHGIVDKSTGHVLAQSICAALIERFRTGTGTTVSINMLDVALSLLWPDGMMNHTVLEPEVRLPPAALTFRLTPTADGHVAIVVLKQEQWNNLIAAFDLGLPPMAGAPYAASGSVSPGAILRAARQVISGLDTDTVVARCTEHDVPCAPVVALDAVAEHPQVVANGSVLHSVHPLLGPVRQPRPTPMFPSMTPQGLLPAPALGQHSAALLAELGIAEETATHLLAEGVVVDAASTG